jgi:hypothetical protein
VRAVRRAENTRRCRSRRFVQYAATMTESHAFYASYLALLTRLSSRASAGPHGQPKYLKQIGQLIEAGPGGEYRSNLKYYSFLQEDRMFSEDLCELLEDPPRPYGSETSPFHARALQFWP